MAALEETAEPLSESDASALLEDLYGVSASIRNLSSETETTQIATCEDGKAYILKTARNRSAAASFELQSTVLSEIPLSREFAVPHLIATRQGDRMFERRLADGQIVWGYLQSLAEGKPSDQLSLTSREQEHMAKAYAHLSWAMAGVGGSTKSRPLLWHICSFPKLASLLPFVKDRDLADDLHVVLDRFSARALPKLQMLPWQIIHNDANPQNIFVLRRSGRCAFTFIDFGDSCLSPRLCDLASLCAHRVTDPNDPLGVIEPFIRGYSSVVRLTALEQSLLCDLVIARQAALLLINAWRAQLHPEDRAYIEKNCERNRRGLQFMLSQDADRIAEGVRRIIQ